MLELSTSNIEAPCTLACGGDTYNTALHLARAGLRVGLLTALGSDPFSAELRRAWVAEGLDPALVLTDAERLPGLYAIRIIAEGEREFFYWRERSAVRRLFELAGIEEALLFAEGARLLYLTGITLSLFDAAGRRRLIELARRVRRRGGDVAFDPNYRPRGWMSVGEARASMDAIHPYVSIALPTFEDERLLRGDASPSDTIARWTNAGADRVAVKLGSRGSLVWTSDGPRKIAALPANPIDTTGAGDAFNAGYLAAVLDGCDEAISAQRGNALAAAVVQHRGAIQPRSGKIS